MSAFKVNKAAGDVIAALAERGLIQGVTDEEEGERGTTLLYLTLTGIGEICVVEAADGGPPTEIRSENEAAVRAALGS